MMDNLQKYKPTDKMIDLISDNYSLLQVMSRFGLSLGFGDKTVKEVCELNGVDWPKAFPGSMGIKMIFPYLH